MLLTNLKVTKSHKMSINNMENIRKDQLGFIIKATHVSLIRYYKYKQFSYI